MYSFLRIAGTIILVGLSEYSLAMELPAEVRLDRAVAKSFAKDASATTVTFRLYLDETCSSSLLGTVSMPLANLDRVEKVKNESLKNDPTPSPKEEWVLEGGVPISGIPESAVAITTSGNVFATVALQNGGDPVVSTCQAQKFLRVSNECGDGVALLDEDCDGSDLAGQTCQTLLSTVGPLECTTGCMFDTSACGICPAGGVLVAQTCWYLADPDTSCTSTCTAHGLPYSPMTLTYAGSGGTTAQCFAVLDALGYSSPPALNVGDYSAGAPVGCLYDPSDPGFRVRITDPAPTTAEAIDNRRRVCACEY